MKILKEAYHRNGSICNGFKVAIVSDCSICESKSLPKRDIDGNEHIANDEVKCKFANKKLVIQFEDEDNCAVLDLGLLKEEKIEFFVNSWRGNYYNQLLKWDDENECVV